MSRVTVVYQRKPTIRQRVRDMIPRTARRLIFEIGCRNPGVATWLAVWCARARLLPMLPPTARYALWLPRRMYARQIRRLT